MNVATVFFYLFSAIMIGMGRAVGETMIVVMAAGNTPVSQAAPNRMAYVYIPNGVITEGWRIPTEGALPAKLDIKRTEITNHRQSRCRVYGCTVS